MKILVTGGTGVVGTGTVTELLARGHEVVLVSRHADSDVRQWPADAKIHAHKGDVATASALRGAADGCELVLHMVAVVDESGDATFDAVNVKGTANVIAEAERAGVKRLVFVSSLGAPEGTSGYHRSKQAAEKLVHGFKGKWVIVRPGNVYGPGDEQISLLLRLVRSPSPLVPKIGDGEQEFQPIWWEDCAKALANVCERTDLAGRELNIAGPEKTSQNDLLRRLGRITGREVHSVALPEMVATLGAKLVSLVGWDLSFSDEQATMLTEGNVIPKDGINALTSILKVEPTPLDAGLRKLADLQPEQLPRHGVGTLKRKRYWADITGSRYTADTLLDLFCANFDEATPPAVEVGSEPATPVRISEGETITMDLPMRGTVQVRVAERTPRRVTLLTLEGHPLAGAVRFTTEPHGAAVRFLVEVYDRAANVLDLVAMRTVGDRLQDATWTSVVERMIARSGGRAADGTQHESLSLDDDEARAVERWVEELSLKRKRDENAEKIASA